MLKYKKIKVGRRYIEAVLIRLLSKNLIVLKGRKGYVMCGYLNLKAAEKFKEVAIRITGASTIPEALKARVDAVSSAARKIGVYKGLAVKETLRLIV